jgi:hypothetical protein
MKSSIAGKTGLVLSLIPIFIYSIIFIPIDLNIKGFNAEDSVFLVLLGWISLLIILPTAFMTYIVGLFKKDSLSYAIAGLILCIFDLLLALDIFKLPVGLVG